MKCVVDRTHMQASTVALPGKGLGVCAQCEDTTTEVFERCVVCICCVRVRCAIQVQALHAHLHHRHPIMCCYLSVLSLQSHGQLVLWIVVLFLPGSVRAAQCRCCCLWHGVVQPCARGFGLCS